MRQRLRPVLGLLSGLLLQAADPAPRPEVLVTPAWLQSHLKDADLRILHVADRRQDYLRGHVPGARFLGTGAFIDSDAEPLSELPSADKLKAAFEAAGIDGGSRVVIYTTGWFPNAARAFFTLEYLGHARVALLDGGIDRWIDEGRPVAAGPEAGKAGAFTPRPQESRLARLPEVRRAAEGAAQLLDNRPHRRYAAGHLPGASELFWQEMLQPDSTTFLPPERLRALLAARGITGDRKVLTYCEVGLQASVGYFLLRHLGLEVAMYDGSYHEWADREKGPVVSGEKPR